jgi:hypothetical protein
LIKTLLPNCRWLTLPSEKLGRDWAELAQQLDQALESLALDLAEESVFLLFDRSPGAVLEGEAEVLVARSVIGPKKNLDGAMKLVDWTQGVTFRQQIKSLDWTQIHLECALAWEDLHGKGLISKSGYILLLKRRLKPQLELTIEVLFPV